MQKLASRFGRFSPSLRSATPLSNDQMREVAPSIFAEAAHESRSDRFAYVPTITVLDGLRKEGFQPFMVAQTRVRDEGKRDFTKHMIRLRHASQIDAAEAREIVVLNAHDGTSSYQMMAGVFRFVCSNGLVFGDTTADVRIRHKGDIVGEVIDGAFEVLGSFDRVDEQREAMRGITLDKAESAIFARAALSLKYEPDATKPAPITEQQLLRPRRAADVRDDLWTVFNTVQENTIQGGLIGRTATGGRRKTRPVEGIDQNIKLNRALWTLAEEMRKLKG